jgi:hypothetical protein
MNIEFVQPANNTSTLYKMARRIPGFYHLGMVTDNIDEEITRLQNENYRKINQFNSTAFGNRSCSFLYNEEFHLIELIQQ